MVKVIVLVACLVIAPPLVAAGLAGIGDSPRAEVLQGPYVPVSLFCTPGGGGSPFTEARSFGGGYADGTLEIQFLDYSYQPMAGIPAQDIWLASTGTALVPCGDGTVPDAPTAADGRTTWTEPLTVGGHLDPAAGDLFYIMINGEGAVVSTELDLRFNSADIDGDGQVNLSDAGLFTMDLYGPYAYRCDFNWDGSVNISDAGSMAGSLGDRCP